MKRVMLPLLVLTLVCFLFAHAQAQWPNENHYKVYNLDPPQTFTGDIHLFDQFGGYDVNQLVLEKFANPVEKNGEPIIFHETHQTWWGVDLIGTGWIVEVDNQFGNQIWRVGDPRYLVLPARKYEPGPLLQNNHYLAYEAFGDPVNLPVHLVDQFSSIDVIAMEPVYFLNPVEKVTPDGEVYPILDPEAHLACYRIEPPMPYDILVMAFDQFGDWEFIVVDHDCLCVPSWKREVVQSEQRTWSDVKGLYHD